MFDKSVNKVVLVGNLGRDPELRYMPNGTPVATLSLATTESWKDQQNGDRKEKTEWHKLVVFNRLGEMCGQYLKKGAKIYIEGKLKTRKWQGQDGQDRYVTEVIVNEIQMMDSRNVAQNQNQFQSAPQQAAPAQQSWGNAPAQHAPQQAAPAQQSWGNAPAQHAPQQAAPAQHAPQQAAPAQHAPQQAAPVQYNNQSMDFDDDIPF